MAVRIDKDGTMRPVTPIESARARRADQVARDEAAQYDAELRASLLLGPARKGHAPILPILHNACALLEYDRRWWGVIAWDDFRGSIVVRKSAPIDRAPGDDWSDDDESRVRQWFQRVWGVDMKILDVRAAVRIVAMQARHHSVRDYLDRLEWDGVQRLDRFLTTHMACEDTPWAELVGPKWMISAVARAYRPGCQVDTMLVLEGEPGRYKSQAVRVLAGEGNFAMELADIGSRDAAQQLQGVWIYEIEEMQDFLSAKVERVKKFVSQPFDRHVGKWRVHAEKFMRGCVFIGTSNRCDYLHDPTGDRRFWPVCCLDVIDLAKLAADRDQVWAEAVARFKAGERWHLTVSEEQFAKVEQQERHKDDPWLDDLRDYLDGKSWCQIRHVMLHLIGEHRERWGDREVKRAVDCLLRLGWTNQRDSVPGPDGQRARRYRPTRTRSVEVDEPVEEPGSDAARSDEMLRDS